MLQESLPVSHLASLSHHLSLHSSSEASPVNVSNKLGDESSLCPEPGGETVTEQESWKGGCSSAESVATLTRGGGQAPQRQHGKLPWRRQSEGGEVSFGETSVCCPSAGKYLPSFAGSF